MGLLNQFKKFEALQIANKEKGLPSQVSMSKCRIR
jgi:hypothetical protein